MVNGSLYCAHKLTLLRFINLSFIRTLCMVLIKYLKKRMLKENKKIGSVFALTQLQYYFNCLFSGEAVMTRVQLVDKLACKMKVTKKDADTYLTAFLDSIIYMLVKDERVVVKGFGSFKIKLKACY